MIITVVMMVERSARWLVSPMTYPATDRDCDLQAVMYMRRIRARAGRRGGRGCAGGYRGFVERTFEQAANRADGGIEIVQVRPLGGADPVEMRRQGCRRFGVERRDRRPHPGGGGRGWLVGARSQHQHRVAGEFVERGSNRRNRRRGLRSGPPARVARDVRPGVHDNLSDASLESRGPRQRGAQHPAPMRRESFRLRALEQLQVRSQRMQIDRRCAAPAGSAAR